MTEHQNAFLALSLGLTALVLLLQTADVNLPGPVVVGSLAIAAVLAGYVFAQAW